MSIILIIIPLLAGIIAFLPIGSLAKYVVTLLGSVLTFLSAVFLPASGLALPWLPVVNSYFSLDSHGAAKPLIIVAALVMIPTLVLAEKSIEKSKGMFFALLLLMQAMLNGVFLAKDLLLYYVFWEATLIPSVIMLGVWGRKERKRAAVQYLLYAVSSSLIMLVAILALRPLSGAASYQFVDLLEATPKLSILTQCWLFAAFALAFAVKVPLMPLHSWLLDFHEQNHPSGVADVAGTLYKVGGWGFFAWALPLFPAAALRFSPLLMVLAVLTAVAAAIMATVQPDLKRLLAYASLSHMGIVAAGIFSLQATGLSGAVYLIAAQMISTGGLFLLSGLLYKRRETFDLDEYGGFAQSAPYLAGLTLFVLFASIGVPGLGNFPGEFLSLMGAYHAMPLFGAIAALSVIGAGVYGVNLFQRLYQGEQTVAINDLSMFEAIVFLPIIVGILWLGLAPAPQLSNIQQQASHAVVQQISSITTSLTTAPNVAHAESANDAHNDADGGQP